MKLLNILSIVNSLTMSRNLTWCLIRRCTEKLRLSKFQVSARNIFHTHKSFAGYENINSDYHEVKTFQEFFDERKISLGRTIITLVKELDVSRETALNFVTEYKTFATLPKATIIKNINVLQEEDIDQETIRKHIYVIADATDNLQQKINILKDNNVDISSAIHLFKLPIVSFKAFASYKTNEKQIIPGYNNRIEYLSTRLETNTAYICSKLSLHPFLLSCNIKKIVEITDFLIDSGIKAQYIVEDLLIYKYSISRIKARVIRAKEADIKPLRPWVVRCPIEAVQKAESRRNDKAKLFKSCTSIEEYIAELMDCDIQIVEGLLRRNPSIRSMNINKLTKKLLMLREFGFTMKEIFPVPRVFHCKDSTLKKRFQEWKTHNTTRPALFALSLSNTVLKRELAKRKDSSN